MHLSFNVRLVGLHMISASMIRSIHFLSTTGMYNGGSTYLLPQVFHVRRKNTMQYTSYTNGPKYP
jgi:hypothetical protein